jgi:hypothetical protein
MRPANVTTPEAGATTTVPTGAAMSIPRWPLPYGELGSTNARITGPATGHAQVPDTAIADGAAANRRIAMDARATDFLMSSRLCDAAPFNRDACHI